MSEIRMIKVHRKFNMDDTIVAKVRFEKASCLAGMPHIGILVARYINEITGKSSKSPVRMQTSIPSLRVHFSRLMFFILTLLDSSSLPSLIFLDFFLFYYVLTPFVQ